MLNSKDKDFVFVLHPPDKAKQEPPVNETNHPFRLRRFLILAGGLLVGMFFFLSQAPSQFNEDQLVTVSPGMTFPEIADLLEEKHLIRSGVIFRLFVEVFGDPTGIPSGTYFLSSETAVWGVAKQFAVGDHRVPSVKITFPEGISVKKMAGILKEHLPDFPADEFLEKAKTKEGRLFPETYIFFASASPDDVIGRMEEEFEKRIAEVEDEIAAQGKTIEEIITMASLIEGEANEETARHIVSGILWRRIEIGMPLQVDAVFLYLMGKGSAELSSEDLDTDSPYNTYRYTGLPPGPIGNPGLEAIDAAIHPTKTDYLYYLTGKDGEMYYAKTFEAHKENKMKYLR